jgi:hypothetical protein
MPSHNKKLTDRYFKSLEVGRIAPVVTVSAIMPVRPIHLTLHRASRSGFHFSSHDDWLTVDEAKALLDQLSSAIGQADSIPADY